MAPTPLPRLAKRDAEGHKGSYGRALLIGGSRGMAGSISLTGLATLRSGAGLVTLAVPDRCLENVAGFNPCYMTVPLPDDERGALSDAALPVLLDLLKAKDAAGIGPGLGRSDAVRRIVMETYEKAPCPLVVDADGLNALAEAGGNLGKPSGPRILTPHPGEFARLAKAFDAPSSGGETDREAMTRAAERLAAKLGCVIVLKGSRTFVTDRERSAENRTGNPGMATGGTGDVLTGVLVALLGQGLSAYDAAVLGVHVHGLAGDLAARELGEVGMIASDLAERLPAAFLLAASEPT